VPYPAGGRLIHLPEFLSLTYTLPYHLVDQINGIAQDTNRSPSEIVAESIRMYLEASRAQATPMAGSALDGFGYHEGVVPDATIVDPVVTPPPFAAKEKDEDDGPLSYIEQLRARDRQRDRAASVEADPNPVEVNARPEIDLIEEGPVSADAEGTGEIHASPEIDVIEDALASPEPLVEETPVGIEPEAVAADDATSPAEVIDTAPPEHVALRQIADPAAGVREKLQAIAAEPLNSMRLRQTLEQVLREVDRKDFSPPEHSTKVAAMARALAAAKGIRGNQLDQIYVAGLVHDIGKACIPDEIIKKPRPSSEEMGLIRKYPEFGADLLSTIPALVPLMPIVAAHQERWNGSGYPEGLERDDIPVAAQIVALCDVYDVLITDRRYRPAYSDDRARQIIQQNVGTLWNPELGRVLLTTVLADAKRPAAAARR
jgi:HD-GYP domain-containing protein (c-di-GMP phosphodiesterase class II)